MAWTLLCMSVVAALVVVSYRRLLAIERLARWAAPQLRARVLRAPDDTASADGATEEQALRARVADLNEATIDLASQLEQPALIPRSCAKACLSLGALVALMQAAEMVGGAGAAGWQSPLVVFGAGCVGGLACSLIGRSAEAVARRLRNDWSALIRRSTEDVSTESRGAGRFMDGAATPGYAGSPLGRSKKL
jgi:hypothetical protein